MDKLLTYLMQASEGNKRRIKSLFSNPSDETSALLNRGVENTQAHLNKLTGKPYNQVNDQAYQDAMNEAALAALTVYHGSPHKFDKFDMSKIGTGEGAQAYGHGLYMAESPDVAKQYRNVLSDTLEVKGDALPLEKRAAQMALTFGDNTPEGAIKWLSKFSEKGANHTNPAMTPELVKSVSDKFKNGSFSQGGAFYKVDIPDEAIPRMLDWDKPLSEQGGVNRFASLPDFARPLDDVEASNVLGQRLHQRLSNKLGEEGARKALSDAGIPGIRYLDGGSRGAGQGTSNYVLFDDQLPRILERNGVPTGNKPWAPGEANSLLINALRKK